MRSAFPLGRGLGVLAFQPGRALASWTLSSSRSPVPKQACGIVVMPELARWSRFWAGADPLRRCAHRGNVWPNHALNRTGRYGPAASVVVSAARRLARAR